MINGIATQKQMKIIENIEKVCEVKCHAKTKKEVYDFIGEWMPRMNFLRQLESNVAIPVYSAKKEYHGNDIHGEWTEETTIRNELSEEILKGHMLRNDTCPLDAMIEYLNVALISEED